MAPTERACNDKQAETIRTDARAYIDTRDDIPDVPKVVSEILEGALIMYAKTHHECNSGKLTTDEVDAKMVPAFFELNKAICVACKDHDVPFHHIEAHFRKLNTFAWLAASTKQSPVSTTKQYIHASAPAGVPEFSLDVHAQPDAEMVKIFDSLGVTYAENFNNLAKTGCLVYKE